MALVRTLLLDRMQVKPSVRSKMSIVELDSGQNTMGTMVCSGLDFPHLLCSPVVFSQLYLDLYYVHTVHKKLILVSKLNGDNFSF